MPPAEDLQEQEEAWMPPAEEMQEQEEARMPTEAVTKLRLGVERQLLAEERLQLEAARPGLCQTGEDLWESLQADPYCHLAFVLQLWSAGISS